MKYLSFELLRKYLLSDNLEDATVAIVKGESLDVIETEHTLRNVCALDLSYNKLEGSSIFDNLRLVFPRCWWLNLSNNYMRELSGTCPTALGLLDISGSNELTQKNLLCLSTIHILRLQVSKSTLDNAVCAFLGDDDLSNLQFASSTSAVVAAVAAALPKVWTVNGEFIRSIERTGAMNRVQAKSASSINILQTQSVISFDDEECRSQQSRQINPKTLTASIKSETTNAVEISNPNPADGSLWWLHSVRTNEREGALLRALQQREPAHPQLVDAFRLDILLEDYLLHASTHNQFAHALARANNSALQPQQVPLMPVLDLHSLLLLPHRRRLDLSVVLTASLLFPLPPRLLTEALTVLLAPHCSVEDIGALGQGHLPAFVRTALVSVVRRVCRREQEELQECRSRPSLPPKPPAQATPAFTPGIGCSHPTNAPNFLTSDAAGFPHLASVKQFLDRPLSARGGNTQDLADSFSDIELEILRLLPDAPTRACGDAYFNALNGIGTSDTAERDLGALGSIRVVSYKDWIPFVARHTVLLLTKAPSCPPLTRQQASQQSQNSYLQLLPLLRAAGMTLLDLEVGVGDGRVLLSGAATTTRPHAFSTAAATTDPTQSTPTAKSTVGNSLQLLGGALPFGVGIPGAGVHSLSWNREGKSDVPSTTAVAAVATHSRTVGVNMDAYVVKSGESDVWNKYKASSTGGSAGGSAGGSTGIGGGGAATASSQSRPGSSLQTPSVYVPTYLPRNISYCSPSKHIRPSSTSSTNDHSSAESPTGSRSSLPKQHTRPHSADDTDPDGTLLLTRGLVHGATVTSLTAASLEPLDGASVGVGMDESKPSRVDLPWQKRAAVADLVQRLQAAGTGPGTGAGTEAGARSASLLAEGSSSTTAAAPPKNTNAGAHSISVSVPTTGGAAQPREREQESCTGPGGQPVLDGKLALTLTETTIEAGQDAEQGVHLQQQRGDGSNTTAGQALSVNVSTCSINDSVPLQTPLAAGELRTSLQLHSAAAPLVLSTNLSSGAQGCAIDMQLASSPPLLPLHPHQARSGSGAGTADPSPSLSLAPVAHSVVRSAGAEEAELLDPAQLSRQLRSGTGNLYFSGRASDIAGGAVDAVGSAGWPGEEFRAAGRGIIWSPPRTRSSSAREEDPHFLTAPHSPSSPSVPRHSSFSPSVSAHQAHHNFNQQQQVAQFPNNKSGPAPVQGYSADATWKASFLLAPPGAVAASNRHVGAVDVLNRWSRIERAPAVVMARPAVASRRLSVEEAAQMLALTAAAPASPTPVHHEARQGPNQAVPSHTVTTESPQADSHLVNRAEATEDRASNGHCKGQVAAARLEAQSELLAAMGTTRNLRNLRDSNRSSEELSKSNAWKANGIVTKFSRRWTQEIAFFEDLEVVQESESPPLICSAAGGGGMGGIGEDLTKPLAPSEASKLSLAMAVRPKQDSFVSIPLHPNSNSNSNPNSSPNSNSNPNSSPNSGAGASVGGSRCSSERAAAGDTFLTGLDAAAAESRGCSGMPGMSGGPLKVILPADCSTLRSPAVSPDRGDSHADCVTPANIAGSALMTSGLESTGGGGAVPSAVPMPEHIKSCSCPVKTLQQSLSMLDLIKLHHGGYQNIHIGSESVEFAPQAVGGKELGPSWYPCWEKQVYMLAPDPARATQAVAGTETGAGAVTGALFSRGSASVLGTGTESASGHQHYPRNKVHTVHREHNKKHRGRGRRAMAALQPTRFENRALPPASYFVARRPSPLAGAELAAATSPYGKTPLGTTPLGKTPLGREATAELQEGRELSSSAFFQSLLRSPISAATPNPNHTMRLPSSSHGSSQPDIRRGMPVGAPPELASNGDAVASVDPAAASDRLLRAHGDWLGRDHPRSSSSSSSRRRHSPDRIHEEGFAGGRPGAELDIVDAEVQYFSRSLGSMTEHSPPGAAPAATLAALAGNAASIGVRVAQRTCDANSAPCTRSGAPPHAFHSFPFPPTCPLWLVDSAPVGAEGHHPLSAASSSSALLSRSLSLTGTTMLSDRKPPQQPSHKKGVVLPVLGPHPNTPLSIPDKTPGGEEGEGEGEGVGGEREDAVNCDDSLRSHSDDDASESSSFAALNLDSQTRPQQQLQEEEGQEEQKEHPTAVSTDLYVDIKSGSASGGVSGGQPEQPPLEIDTTFSDASSFTQTLPVLISTPGVESPANEPKSYRRSVHQRSRQSSPNRPPLYRSLEGAGSIVTASELQSASDRRAPTGGAGRGKPSHFDRRNNHQKQQQQPKLHHFGSSRMLKSMHAPSNVPLTALTKIFPAVSVGAKRGMRYPGQPQQPWVGKNHYGALPPASVPGSRVFRCAIPRQLQQQHQQQQHRQQQQQHQQQQHQQPQQQSSAP